jgi:hypothetical protein
MDKENMYRHRVKQYLAIKQKGILPFVTTCMNLEDIILSKISLIKKTSDHYVTYMWDLESLISQKQRRVVIIGTEDKGKVEMLTKSTWFQLCTWNLFEGRSYVFSIHIITMWGDGVIISHHKIIHLKNMVFFVNYTPIKLGKNQCT